MNQWVDQYRKLSHSDVSSFTEVTFSLETMEGRVMAIDSSIWIYQFQATMRDKEGRGLVNAHVVGVMRRICKLLFYGIKPVFVFDGGAPVLKRATIVRYISFYYLPTEPDATHRPSVRTRKVVLPQVMLRLLRDSLLHK